MRIISIFLGLALSSIVRAQNPSRNIPFTRILGRQIQDEDTDYEALVQGYHFLSSTSSEPAIEEYSELDEDFNKLVSRHAEANLFGGLKKMVTNGLKAHGPKITKFAHGKLQEQLKKFIPAGSKDKGKDKDKSKDKDKDKDKGKEKDKSKDKKDKKDKKGEKDSSGKDQGYFGSRDLLGGMQGPMYDNDLRSRKVDYFETLMNLYELAERGAAFIDPDRPLWDYD